MKFGNFIFIFAIVGLNLHCAFMELIFKKDGSAIGYLNLLLAIALLFSVKNELKEMGKMENDERLCNCGSCSYCKVYQSSDYDYETEDYLCSRCNGAGCTKCE